MPDQEGFKNKPNCGVLKADLERGFSREGEEDHGFGVFEIGYGDYLGDTSDLPMFKGGFAGRPMGWER